MSKQVNSQESIKRLQTITDLMLLECGIDIIHDNPIICEVKLRSLPDAWNIYTCYDFDVDQQEETH